MKFEKLTNYQMKLLLNRLPKPKLIGLDLGGFSTGVSVSCDRLKQSYFLKAIKSNDAFPSKVLFQTLRDLCNKEKATGIVLGNTKYLTSEARKDKFLEELPKSIDLPVTEVDESASTIQAKQVLLNFQDAVQKYGHLHKDRTLKDGIAAMIILQRFLDYYNR